MKKLIKKAIKSDGIKICLSLISFALGLLLSAFGLSSLSLVAYLLALAVSGCQVFLDAVKGLLRRDPLDEKFLMSIAAIGAMIVGEWSEGCAVMIFYLIGETFERRAVRKSRNAIKSLMEICPDEASVLIDGKEEIIDAEDVEVGSIIVIRPGERVPLDCVVMSGRANVDTSGMTGEPLPMSVSEGDSLLSGFVVKDGLLNARVIRPAEASGAQRVLELVELAGDRKSKEESFITKFSRFYTPIVVSLAFLVAIVPPVFGIFELSFSIYTALTFLVISCPCALVISVPLAFFGGIGGAASRGILFKGGNVFSKVANVDTVAFDKTGTITSGRFEVSKIIAIEAEEKYLCYLAASLESVSNHPVAETVKCLSSDYVTPVDSGELSGLGVYGVIDGKKCYAGNIALMKQVGIALDNSYIDQGSVYIACEGRLMGVICLSDRLKPEAKEAISELKKLGVKRNAILSGDKCENVCRIAEEVGIDEAYYQLTPEEKYNKLEELIAVSKSTMYVGDGINDAPSLARADVGVAMGGLGQDSAIEASDVVIVSDKLTKLSEALLISRKTVRIARENIVFAIGVKAIILLLGIFGFADMWLAVFSDVGVAVIAILNAMRALKTPKIK